MGVCPSCGSTSPQVDSAIIAPYLEALADAYVIRAVDGRPLSELIREDWDIFSPGFRDPGALVRDVLGVGAATRFIAKQPQGGLRLEHWAELRKEIREVNRFFPESSLSESSISRIFDLLEFDLEDVELFRARVVASGETLAAEQMGAPPAQVATAGRANPVGIPYLYLASDVETALSEIKPQVGSEALLCAFRRSQEDRIRVVDLVDPRRRISPFKWSSEIAELRSTIPLIEELGLELSIPVQASSAAVDYLASQYLCELAKKCGFSGVRYASSVSAGVNYAFFDVNIFRPTLPLRRFKVTGVDVRSIELE